MSMPLTLLKRNVRLATLQSVRCYATKGYWNKDWRPGPAPKTEEERIACAKKYYMIPADYKSYSADDWTAQYGDYPKLEIVAAESRDPHERFDMGELHRNFGEPLHVDFDMHAEERINWNKPAVLPMSYFLKFFCTMVGSLLFLSWFFSGWKTSACLIMPRHDPENPKQKHLSFELVPINEK